MTVGDQTSKHYRAFFCGLALVTSAVAFTVSLSVSNSWTQTRVLATVTLFAISGFLIEFGNSGRWFLRFSPPRSTRLGLLRGLAGISGLLLLLLALGLSIAFVTGKWRLTAVGFILGMYSTSFLLIRSAITGTLWASGKVAVDER